jgi:chemotaxis protein histidine kinase CheA
MSTPDEIVAAELRRLSAAFMAQLPDQVQAVEEDAIAWLSAPRDAGRYEILSHRVHQLKGAGSTFGCPGISRAARMFERRIAEYRGDLEAGRMPAAEDVESAMAELQNEARRVRTQSGAPEASP